MKKGYYTFVIESKKTAKIEKALNEFFHYSLRGRGTHITLPFVEYDAERKAYVIEIVEGLGFTLLNSGFWTPNARLELGIGHVTIYSGERHKAILETRSQTTITDLDGRILIVEDLDKGIKQAKEFCSYVGNSELGKSRSLYWQDMLAKLNELKFGKK